MIRSSRNHAVRRTVAGLALLLSLPSLTLRAAIVETIQPSVVNTNSNGNAFDVVLTNTGPSAVTIGSFSFGLQANTNNVTFTRATTATNSSPYIFGAFSLFGPDITTSTGTTPPSITASDVFAIAGAGATLGAGVTAGLAHVIFNVGSAVGLTVLTFQASNTFLDDPFGNDLTITTLSSGTITVNGIVTPPAAVPENGAGSAILLLLGLAALPLASSATRRKANA